MLPRTPLSQAHGAGWLGWCWRPSRRKLLEITLKVLQKDSPGVIAGQIRHQHHLLTHPRTSHSKKGVIKTYRVTEKTKI